MWNFQVLSHGLFSFYEKLLCAATDLTPRKYIKPTKFYSVFHLFFEQKAIFRMAEGEKAWVLHGSL